ncbi:hypothetical protein GOP47_0011438 [Adiantum capillus-veneris]|uniref:Uncharacterized protein n=1 Tax=Adiantum capillus-veneris TaxID=13818 RepID=A0A9D4UST1_ADICA|nr:hypothetical protein GOP47_0011438 [Adiantum capillus-veneris]
MDIDKANVLGVDPETLTTTNGCAAHDGRLLLVECLKRQYRQHYESRNCLVESNDVVELKVEGGCHRWEFVEATYLDPPT